MTVGGQIVFGKLGNGLNVFGNSYWSRQAAGNAQQIWNAFIKDIKLVHF